MKRVGMIVPLFLGVTGLLWLPGTASAQQYYGEYYTAQPYVYGYDYGYSTPPYSGYRYDWREDRREHRWHEREERREREWRRHEWRDHERRERSRWRDRDDWRH